MGDVLGIVIMIVVYALVIGASKNKRNAQRASGQPSMPRVHAASSPRKPSVDVNVQGDAQHAQAASAQGSGATVRDQSRMMTDLQREAGHPTGIHLHTVAQDEMHFAGEGEDPCHAGGHDRKEEEIHDVHGVQQQPVSLLTVDDMVRSVVMSEILMRPAERVAIRRTRRGR